MRIEPVPTPAVNRADRVQLGRPATMRDLSRAPIDVIIENLSETGALLVAEDTLPIGTLISLGIAGAGIQLARVTRNDTGAIAAEFMVPLDAATVTRAQSAETLVSVAFPQILVEHPSVSNAAPAGRAGDFAAVTGQLADAVPGQADARYVEPNALTYAPTAGRHQPAIPQIDGSSSPDPRAIAAFMPQQREQDESGAPKTQHLGLWSLLAAVIVALLFYLIL